MNSVHLGRSQSDFFLAYKMGKIIETIELLTNST